MKYALLLILLLPGAALAQSSAISGRVEQGTAGQMAGYATTGTTLSPVNSGNSNINGVLNVQTFGADPTGVNDSTSNIQSAVNTACPSASCTKAVYFPAGNYKVTSLNFTNLDGLVLEGDSTPGWPSRISSIICTEPVNNTGVCIDFTGDFYNRMDNLTISANIGNAPLVMVLLAKNNSGLAQGIEYKWRNDTFIQQGGDWGTYDYGGEDWTCQNCYWNGTPNHAGLMISVANTPGITSPYQTLLPAPTSMTILNMENANFSTLAAGTGVNAPVIFDTGPYYIAYGELQGYCNTQNNVPCITDWSAADTGRIYQYNIDIDHEAYGASPGPVVTFPHTNYSGHVKGMWNIIGSTSNPALNFGAGILWLDIDMFSPEGVEQNYEVVCTGTNVLGVTIHNYYQNTGGVESVQRNNCPGAADTGGIYGLGGGTQYNAHVNKVWNAQLFGAIGDAVYSGDVNHIGTAGGEYGGTDGAITSGGTSFTSAQNSFPSYTIGEEIVIWGAGPSNGYYIGHITGNITGGVSVSPAASTTVTGASYIIHNGDGVISAGGTTFTAASGGISQFQVGDLIGIAGAGASGGYYVGTVTGWTNATTVTVSPAASTSVSGRRWVIGKDNTAALNTWFNWLRQSSSGEGYLPAGVYLHRGLNLAGAGSFKITGAGSSFSDNTASNGGSALLCVAPNPNGVTSGMGNVCHDFTGDSFATIRDMAFINGPNEDQGAGKVNALFARLNTTPPASGPYTYNSYFAILNTIDNDMFRGWGGPTNYNVAIMSSEQNTWSSDWFNANTDTAQGLYISTSNTPGFTSPWVGSLTTSTSTTINTFMGGRQQFSSNGSGSAIFIDGSPLDSAIIGGFGRLNGVSDAFIADNASSGASDWTIQNLRIEQGCGGQSFINCTHDSNAFIRSVGTMGAFSIIGNTFNFNAGVSADTNALQFHSLVGSNIASFNPNVYTNPEITCTGFTDDNRYDNLNYAWVQAACRQDGGTVNTITGGEFVNGGVGTSPTALANLAACSALTEGLSGTQNNSTAACSAGTTATTAGTTHCQVYCNGTNWIQTGR